MADGVGKTAASKTAESKATETAFTAEMSKAEGTSPKPAEAQQNNTHAPTKDEKQEPVLSVSTRVGASSGSTPKNETTRGVAENVTISTAKPINLTKNEKLTVTPTISVTVVQSDKTNDKGVSTPTGSVQLEADVTTTYQALPGVKVYSELHVEADFNKVGPHPTTSPAGMDKSISYAGGGMKVTIPASKQVDINLMSRARLVHADAYTDVPKTGVTNTGRLAASAGATYKPAALPGVKITTEGFAEARVDLNRGTTTAVATVTTSVMYTTHNKNVDLVMKVQNGVGGTTISPEGSMGVGDRYKGGNAVSLGVNVRF